MSTYRNLNRNRHADEKLAKVGPISIAVWDYLCCNDGDHLSGIYRLSVAKACEDTKWSHEQFSGAIDELVDVGLIEWCPSTKLVWIKNMLHFAYKNPNAKQLKGVLIWIASLPKVPIVTRMISYYRQKYGVDLSLGYPIDTNPGSAGSVLSDSDSVSDSVSDSATQAPTDEAVLRDFARAAKSATESGRLPRGASLGGVASDPAILRLIRLHGIDEIIDIACHAWTTAPKYATQLFSVDGRCFAQARQRWADDHARKAPTLPPVVEERSHVTPDEAEAAMQRLGWRWDETGRLVTDGQ